MQSSSVRRTFFFFFHFSYIPYVFEKLIWISFYDFYMVYRFVWNFLIWETILNEKHFVLLEVFKFEDFQYTTIMDLGVLNLKSKNDINFFFFKETWPFWLLIKLCLSFVNKYNNIGIIVQKHNLRILSFNRFKNITININLLTNCTPSQTLKSALSTKHNDHYKNYKKRNRKIH